MAKKLFLLDGMALVYRAHFALMARPIYTSKGVNSSALYGFTQTLLDILNNQQPTHIAVAFDTDAPTQRHRDYPEYKIQREAMPEDLSAALPHVRRMVQAFNITVLTRDGYEADDIIGTLARRAEKEGFESYMVTPDKDFGQLVDQKTFLYKPSRMGDAVEILGVPEIRAKWGVERPEQVIDVIGLWGDTSDNIPGVPGIGEKTASKLIAQYGSIENVLAHTGELKGKLKEALETHHEQALLSKRLATILCDVPVDLELESLKVRETNREEVRNLCLEFEFNSIGRRLFGEDFKAGRGFAGPPAKRDPHESRTGILPVSVSRASPEEAPAPGQEPARVASEAPPSAPDPASSLRAPLKTAADVPHEYQIVGAAPERTALVDQLRRQGWFCFRVDASGADPKQANLQGLAFALAPHRGAYVPLPADDPERGAVLDSLRPVLESEAVEKVGYNLKYDCSVLKWNGVAVKGKLFDLMLAHSLAEPELRHTLEFLSEAFLGYELEKPPNGDAAPPPTSVGPDDPQGMLPGQSTEIPIQNPESSIRYPAPASSIQSQAIRAAERADVALQLRGHLEALLREKGQERVFYEIEAPLVPVLVDMEMEGIRVDARALAEFGEQLAKSLAGLEMDLYRLAGTEFNLNSPKQLGEILFEKLRLAESPKKTKTGQYATDEATLLALAPDHELVRRLLEFRELSKLKSTYVDTLPSAISPKTGRIHTTYYQAATATGRLNSQNPNLQNIPIRSEQGREIRKAFVPRDAEHVLLSADYSQIELRVIAALSGETGLLEAFHRGVDIHAATAARVYGVFVETVTTDMRRTAKMVNYGLAYGMSAFGLAQRLGIPRKEASVIMDQYFAQFPGLRKYMTDTIEFARARGYVQTVTGRRRYLRDIRSSNATVRGAAERNAINMPIQGTAADLIKSAMVNIHRELDRRGLKTRMLLQVHDELVFDLHRSEQAEVMALVEEKMKNAIPLDVPVVVEMGVGQNWLEAH